MTARWPACPISFNSRNCTGLRSQRLPISVDLARLAGLNPSGVICEIMNDDGTMARLPDLVQFAQLHGLKVATIADLGRSRAPRRAQSVRRHLRDHER